MRCIFCKTDSSESKSVEHVIPESLGNTEHILPKGAVCDKCNNYFARKVEGPLLNSDYFKHARFGNKIRSKRGRIPPLTGIHYESGSIIQISNEDGGYIPSKQTDVWRFIASISSNKSGRLIFPVAIEPDEYLLSRFLGKVAFESLALRLMNFPEGLEEIVNKEELDRLRDYIRRGSSNLIWPFHARRIYPEQHLFHEEGYGNYEVLHEFNFLYMESQDLYFILIVFGVEYAINLDRPDISEYFDWLHKNGGKSPLYLQENLEVDSEATSDIFPNPFPFISHKSSTDSRDEE